jgi:hypothetical protein
LGIGALAVVFGCASASGEDVVQDDAALASDWGEIDDSLDVVTEAELDEAAALPEEDVDRDALDPDVLDPKAIATKLLAAPAAAPPPPPPTQIDLPPGCNESTSLDLVVYYERSDSDLLAALARHANRCARYWINVPKVSGSAGVPDNNLWPRELHAQAAHAHGAAFRATAEVHWGSTSGGAYAGWKNVEVVKEGPGRYSTRRVPRAQYFRTNWYLKGVVFRQRMAKRGYRTQDGDTWHVNELESSWARSRAYLRAVRDLTRGLADGDPEYDAFTDPDPDISKLRDDEKRDINESAHRKGVRGVLFLAAIGKRLPAESSDAGLRDAVKRALRTRGFWDEMAKDVEFWGQERYASYPGYCQGSLNEEQTRLTAFQEELVEIARSVPRYRSGARAGQSPVGTALAYLHRHNAPVLNAAWSSFSGAEQRTAGEMGDFFAGQARAHRAYQADHDVPAGLVGVYFRPNDVAGATPNVRFAERVASVVNAAWDGRDGHPGDACADGCRCTD